MIDFLNIKLSPESIPIILNHPQLEWIVHVSEQTGELIRETKTAQYGGMEFLHKRGKGEHLHLKGSIHKHWHPLQKNDNDFSLWDFIDTTINICNTFDINPYLTAIKNVEFGLNVITPFDHKRLLFDGILAYKYNPFHPMKTKGKIKIGVNCSFQQYDIKAYSKQIQYGLFENVFRWELHYNRQQPLKKYRISTLADLLHPLKVKTIMDDVVKKFGESLVYESKIITKDLKPKDSDLITKGQNPKYWERQKEEVSNKEDRNRLSYLVDRFRHLNQTYTPEPQQPLISKLLANKAANMLAVDEQKFRLLTNFLEQYQEHQIQTFNSSNMGLIVLNSPPQPHTKRIINKPLENRVCLGCGKDISHQRPNTIFCSAKYVGEKMAHRCRNQNSNSRNNLKRKIQKELNKGLLFDIWEIYDYENLKTKFLVDSKEELLKKININKIAS